METTEANAIKEIEVVQGLINRILVSLNFPTLNAEDLNHAIDFEIGHHVWVFYHKIINALCKSGAIDTDRDKHRNIIYDMRLRLLKAGNLRVGDNVLVQVWLTDGGADYEYFAWNIRDDDEPDDE